MGVSCLPELEYFDPLIQTLSQDVHRGGIYFLDKNGVQDIFLVPCLKGKSNRPLRVGEEKTFMVCALYPLECFVRGFILSEIAVEPFGKNELSR